MKRALLTAAAAVAIAAPAYAQDTGGYVGIEGGLLLPQTTKTDVDVINSGGTNVGSIDQAFRINYDNGFDVDAIAGYDFGMFRLEAEGGYKRAGIKSLDVNSALTNLYSTQTGTTVTASDFALDGNVSVWSAMANGLVDFNAGGVGIYAGGGVGRAWVKYSPDNSDFSTDSDNAWAYQLIAGAYVPVGNNVDVGVKYRYFQTDRLHYASDVDIGGSTYTNDLNGRFKSHSILASLVYKFGAPAPAPVIPAAAPAPPPPAAAPATQTCADGTVILATEMCPAPPPPPPPPPAPPAGERG